MIIKKSSRNRDLRRRLLNFLENNHYLRSKRSSKLLRPYPRAARRNNGKNDNEKPKLHQSLKGANNKSGKDKTYYKCLYEFMCTLTTEFVDLKCGVKAKLLFKKFENVFTKQVVELCKNYFKDLLAQYDQALDEDFVLDGFWNYLRERGVITDGDLNFLLGNNPHKKTSFEEVKSEVELIAFIRTNIADKDAVVEALISRVCKALVHNQNQENFGRNPLALSNLTYESYIERHGMGMAEFVFKDMRILFALMKRIVNNINYSGNINTKNLEQNKICLYNRIHYMNQKFRNCSAHNIAPNLGLFGNAMKLFLTSILSDRNSPQSEDFREKIDELLKSYLEIVFKVKYPEDLLNKEFNGNLHVTIPKAVRAEDKLVNNKPKDILENVLCSGKDFTNKKQMKDEFIHGYFEGFDRRMGLHNQSNSRNKQYKFIGNCPLRVHKIDSLEAMQHKVSLMYQYIIDTFVDRKKQANIEAVGKARNLLVECIAHKLDISDRNVFSELKKVTDPLQRMQTFSVKKFIGNADEQLEKVVKELCDFLSFLRSNVRSKQVEEKIENFVEIFREVWNRPNNHFNFTIMSPSVHLEYQEYVREANKKNTLVPQKESNYFDLGLASGSRDYENHLKNQERNNKTDNKNILCAGWKDYKSAVMKDALESLDDADTIKASPVGNSNEVVFFFDYLPNTIDCEEDLIFRLCNDLDVGKLKSIKQIFLEEKAKNKVYLVTCGSNEDAATLISSFESGNAKDLKGSGIASICSVPDSKLIKRQNEMSDNRRVSVHLTDCRNLQQVKRRYIGAQLAYYARNDRNLSEDEVHVYIIFNTRNNAEQALNSPKGDHRVSWGVNSNMVGKLHESVASTSKSLYEKTHPDKRKSYAKMLAEQRKTERINEQNEQNAHKEKFKFNLCPKKNMQKLPINIAKKVAPKVERSWVKMIKDKNAKKHIPMNPPNNTNSSFAMNERKLRVSNLERLLDMYEDLLPAEVLHLIEGSLHYFKLNVAISRFNTKIVRAYVAAVEQYNKLDYSMPKMPAPREDRSEGYPRFAQQKLKLKLRPPPRPNKHRPAGQGPSKMLTFKKRIPTSDLKGPLDFVDEYNQDPDKALKKYDKFSKKIEQMQQPQVQQPPRRGGFQPFQPSVFDEPSYDWEQMDIHPMDKQTIGYSDSSWQNEVPPRKPAKLFKARPQAHGPNKIPNKPVSDEASDEWENKFKGEDEEEVTGNWDSSQEDSSDEEIKAKRRRRGAVTSPRPDFTDFNNERGQVVAARRHYMELDVKIRKHLLASWRRRNVNKKSRGKEGNRGDEFAQPREGWSESLKAELAAWVERFSARVRRRVMEEQASMIQPGSSRGIKRRMSSRNHNSKKRRVDLMERKIKKYEKIIQHLNEMLHYDQE